MAGRVVRIGSRTARLLSAAYAALALAACDQLATTPFPGFLGYTDISANLVDEIDDIWDGGGSIDYTVEVVSTPNDPTRVLLLVEPPIDQSGSDFTYRGRLMFFDEDLNLLNVAAPITALDTFGRPFTYDHGGTILVSNSLYNSDGTIAQDSAGEALEAGQDFLGIDGPGFVDTSDGVTIVFTLDPGVFTGFELQWYEFFDGSGTRPWSLDGPFQVGIIPEASRSSTGGAGYQILDAVYNDESDEVTFLFSEPSVPRVVGVRATLADMQSGAIVSLVDRPGDFPIEIDADRPLDVHADRNGFFLRRRDGWLDRYEWPQSGNLRQIGDEERLVGDRAFDRAYGFLSGPDAPTGYMYRFDPSSREFTRFNQWW